MNTRWHRPRTAILFVCFTLSLVAVAARAQTPAGKRPMTFMDILAMRQVSSPAVSPDGKWVLYTLATPDWKAAKDLPERALPERTSSSTVSCSYSRY